MGESGIYQKVNCAGTTEGGEKTMSLIITVAVAAAVVLSSLWIIGMAVLVTACGMILD